VYDKEGRSVLHQKWNAGADPQRISVQALPAGLYQVHLKSKTMEQALSFMKSGE
jgi:hypothetical protein